ncbi:hypothetical protein ABPG74_022689 [Tetrahymena malaccensis]
MSNSHYWTRLSFCKIFKILTNAYRRQTNMDGFISFLVNGNPISKPSDYQGASNGGYYGGSGLYDGVNFTQSVVLDSGTYLFTLAQENTEYDDGASTLICELSVTIIGQHIN